MNFYDLMAFSRPRLEFARSLLVMTVCDGLLWYGMVWYGMVWYGMVWYGKVWYGMVR